MTQALHDIAERDTPQQVEVPKGWPGLLVWAVGRFGGIIIATALCAVALKKVYEDMQSTNQRILILMESRAVSDARLSDALNQLSKVVDDLRREAASAHRQQPH